MIGIMACSDSIDVILLQEGIAGDLVKTNQLGKNPGHAGALKFKTQNSTLKEELRSRERNLVLRHTSIEG